MTGINIGLVESIWENVKRRETVGARRKGQRKVNIVYDD